MPYEDKLKDVEGNIPFNIVIRGGGGFGRVWGYVEGNISFNIMARGGGGLTHLIAYEDKLTVIYHST